MPTYSIYANELLEEHEHDANHCPPDDGWLEHVDPARDFELELAVEVAALDGWMSFYQCLSIVYGFRPDSDPLGLNAWVGGREASQLAQNGKTVSISAFPCQPSRGKGEEKQCDGKGDTGRHLVDQGEAKAPIGGYVSGAVRLNVSHCYLPFSSLTM